jgi:hypothetical protein
VHLDHEFIIVLHIAHQPDEKLSCSIYKTCRVAKLKACVYHFSKNRIFSAILSISANGTAVDELTEGKAQTCSAVETLYATILFHQWAACHESDHLLKSGGAKMGSELQRDADDVMDSENSQADDGNGELKQSNQGAILCLFSSETCVCLHLLIVMVVGWAAASSPSDG